MNGPRRSRDGVPALAVGFSITTLGVIRCLGRAGIPTFCVHRDLGLVGNSRWCRCTAQRIRSGEQLSEFLRSLPFERAVLFPCSDDWVLEVAALDPELTRRFPSSRPARETQETLIDKQRFALLLERLGVPHPRTVVLRAPDDLEGRSDEDLVGWFLKPCDSLAFHKRHRAKGFSIASKADAIAKLRSIQDLGLEILLQEYIPGPATQHVFIDGFVDRNGRVCARFARRRLRMHPPLYGNSSLMISIPIEEATQAVEDLERLLASVSYRGIFSAEFKYDQRDGLFKILEVNSRAWWYVEFAARCGVDVCSMAYRDALDLDVDPVVSYSSGVRCVNFATDVSASMAMIRKGELSVAAALGTWLSAKHVVFHPDDPVPAIREITERLRKRFGAGRLPKPVGT